MTRKINWWGFHLIRYVDNFNFSKSSIIKKVSLFNIERDQLSDKINELDTYAANCVLHSELDSHHTKYGVGVDTKENCLFVYIVKDSETGENGNHDLYNKPHIWIYTDGWEDGIGYNTTVVGSAPTKQNLIACVEKDLNSDSPGIPVDVSDDNIYCIPFGRVDFSTEVAAVVDSYQDDGYYEDEWDEYDY